MIFRTEDDDDADDIGAEEEPLNSADDVSEEEQSDLFDTDNVVVCQYDKVSALWYQLKSRDKKNSLTISDSYDANRSPDRGTNGSFI